MTCLYVYDCIIKANSLLNKDEVEWEVEHAQFPSQDKQPTPPVDKANLTQWDVSCAMNDVNNEMSIGKFFLNRCEDVRNIIKIGSPPKEREILGALVSESFLSSEFFLRNCTICTNIIYVYV